MTAATTAFDDSARRRVLLRTFGIAGAELCAVVPAVALVASPMTPRDALMLMRDMSTYAVSVGLVIALLLEGHEWRLLQGRPRSLWMNMTLALLLTAIVASVSPTSTGVRLGLSETTVALRLFNFWIGLFLSTLSVAYLTQRRETARVEARVHQHELQLELARRRLSDSTARAAQARLDPTILFRSLSEAHAAYSNDRERGDQVLDRLTSYLRAALAASTGSPNNLEESRARLNEMLGEDGLANAKPSSGQHGITRKSPDEP